MTADRQARCGRSTKRSTHGTDVADVRHVRSSGGAPVRCMDLEA